MESIMTRKEFEALAEQNNWEVYTQRQVYQFSQDILKSVDEQERFNGAVDYASLSRVEVLNDDLTKSVMFYREQQVEWDKAEDGTLMKARSGIYKDTPANRKKGIVGQRYGKQKENIDNGQHTNKTNTSTTESDKKIGDWLQEKLNNNRFTFDSGAIDFQEAAEHYVKEFGGDTDTVRKKMKKIRSEYKKEWKAKKETEEKERQAKWDKIREEKENTTGNKPVKLSDLKVGDIISDYPTGGGEYKIVGFANDGKTLRVTQNLGKYDYKTGKVTDKEEIRRFTPKADQKIYIHKEFSDQVKNHSRYRG